MTRDTVVGRVEGVPPAGHVSVLQTPPLNPFPVGTYFPSPPSRPSPSLRVTEGKTPEDFPPSGPELLINPRSVPFRTGSDPRRLLEPPRHPVETVPGVGQWRGEVKTPS